MELEVAGGDIQRRCSKRRPAGGQVSSLWLRRTGVPHQREAAKEGCDSQESLSGRVSATLYPGRLCVAHDIQQVLEPKAWKMTKAPPFHFLSFHIESTTMA